MNKNIGQNIKSLAKFCGPLAFGLAVIAAYFVSLSGNFIGAVCILVAGLICWLSSWPLYGFGQLIEDVHALRKKTESPTDTASDELPEL